MQENRAARAVLSNRHQYQMVGRQCNQTCWRKKTIGPSAMFVSFSGVRHSGEMSPRTSANRSEFSEGAPHDTTSLYRCLNFQQKPFREEGQKRENPLRRPPFYVVCRV